MNPEITDQTLVLQRLKEGDEKTFELLFHRYYAALCFFANKILKDEEAARDVVQEVFIRFYEKSYDPKPAAGRIASYIQKKRRKTK